MRGVCFMTTVFLPQEIVTAILEISNSLERIADAREEELELLKLKYEVRDGVKL